MTALPFKGLTVLLVLMMVTRKTMMVIRKTMMVTRKMMMMIRGRCHHCILDSW